METQDKKLDILFFGGQSNMQGQTEAPVDEIPVPNAWEYHYLTDELIPLHHPVGEDIGEILLCGAHEKHGCMIPDFCRAYIAETGNGVIAVSAAKGATMVSEWLLPCERDIPILSAQEELGKTDDFVLLTGITGVCTNAPESRINPYAGLHDNNAAMTLIGNIAGRNLGLYRKGMDFELEEEPYPELRKA